jgi:hypothetical protein
LNFQSFHSIFENIYLFCAVTVRVVGIAVFPIATTPSCAPANTVLDTAVTDAFALVWIFAVADADAFIVFFIATGARFLAVAFAHAFVVLVVFVV